MPAERTAMRHVREVLRLKFVGGVPTREIARRIGIAPSTVHMTIRPFQVAGYSHSAKRPISHLAPPRWDLPPARFRATLR
jgi:Sigma-70, region 4